MPGKRLPREWISAGAALSLVVGLTGASGCGTAPIMLNLDGTYSVNVTGAEAGSFLPPGTTGEAVIANSLLTQWLGTTLTNPQSPTVSNGVITWKGTLAAPNNPLISSELNLEVTDQGNGTLTGRVFFSILGVASPASQVTLTRQ